MTFWKFLTAEKNPCLKKEANRLIDITLGRHLIRVLIVETEVDFAALSTVLTETSQK